ncbi:hypothetical protein V8G54_013041 [Vigna mungo]|uniref:Uncharacterized protein n=1 Tax=Vigna mungo TaxID=3915 RepID=A0AAQ3NUB5_VIGMU
MVILFKATYQKPFRIISIKLLYYLYNTSSKQHIRNNLIYSMFLVLDQKIKLSHFYHSPPSLLSHKQSQDCRTQATWQQSTREQALAQRSKAKEELQSRRSCSPRCST